MNDQSRVDPALRHGEAEIEAAIAAKDMVALRRIVESEGLTWDDPALPEKYRSGNDCRTQP